MNILNLYGPMKLPLWVPYQMAQMVPLVPHGPTGPTGTHYFIRR